jgi:hypothetical protein
VVKPGTFSVPAETNVSIQVLSVDHATFFAAEPARSPPAGDFPARLVAGPGGGAWRFYMQFRDVFGRVGGSLVPSSTRYVVLTGVWDHACSGI